VRLPGRRQAMMRSRMTAITCGTAELWKVDPRGFGREPISSTPYWEKRVVLAVNADLENNQVLNKDGKKRLRTK